MDLRSSVLLRLVLLAFTCFQFPASQAASQSLQWTSPSAQTVYGPGDTIKGEWSSGKPLVSPSVSLCAKGSEGDDSSDEDGDENEDVCGEAIWPSVESTGDQSYFSLSAPSVSSVTDYYLRLKDDFGNKMKSPVFALSPDKSNESNEGNLGSDGDDETNQPDSPSTQDPDSAQEPSLETPVDDTSSSTTHSLPSSKPPKPSSLVSNSPAVTDSPNTSGTSRSKTTGAYSNGIQPSGPAAAVSYIPTGPPIPSSGVSGSPGSLNLTPAQYATSSRASVPTAAIAIPLALVGATLLTSLILCFAHRRSLAAQRRRNSALIASQQEGPGGAPPAAVQAAPSFTSLPSSATIPGDIEKAISALNGNGDTRSVNQLGSVVYVPVTMQQQRSQRQDVRRERVHSYERSYTPSIASSQYSFTDNRHEFGRTPAQEYASSFPSYLDSHNSREPELDDITTTGSVLSDHLSPTYDDSRPSRKERRGDFLRPLPCSHTRTTVPSVDDAMFSRQDVYKVVNRVLANSALRGSRS